MNKILNVLFALLAIVTFPAQIQAQDETIIDKLPHQKKNFTIASHPLYHFNSGVRLDFEKRIKNTPSWIQLGISGNFLGKRNNENNYWTIASGDEFSYLRGGGLELNYKYFVNKKESLYFAGGGSLFHSNIEYMGDYWISYIEDGLVYQIIKYGKINQKINKLGINTYFGYQLPTPTFLFDMFVGLGYRHSFRNNDTAKLFDDSMISLGYTGLVFITGVRFGVKF
ncbi:MAG: hypothetical protein LBS43_01795 [Prevotellaceae bacterium]|jgi:hypothetical protein|nr:hypothetical protein [Prevotellaceae bacterium]